jgi:hypothetical protein
MEGRKQVVKADRHVPVNRQTSSIRLASHSGEQITGRDDIDSGEQALDGPPGVSFTC